MGKNIKTKKTPVKTESNIAKKAILLVYLLVLFVPPLGALDVMNTQWLYVALVNFGAVGYILLNPSQFDLSFHNKLSKFIFLGSTVFVGIALLSFTKSMVISESVVHLTFLLNTLIAFFVFYTIVKENPKEYFEYVALLFVVFLGIEAYQVVIYFIDNNSQQRSHELLLAIPHNYGNRNILATSLVIKLFISFYYLFRFRMIWRYLYMLLFGFGTFAILLIGARTAIYCIPLLFFIIITRNFILHRTDKITSQKKITIVLPFLLTLILSFYLSLSLNKIRSNELNSFWDLVFTKTRATLEKENRERSRSLSLTHQKFKRINHAGLPIFRFESLFQKDKKYLEKKSSKLDYFESGRGIIWLSGIETLKQNVFLGSGLGQWKLISKPKMIKNGWNGYYYPRRIHNDFLQILYETGLFGFTVFIIFFGLIFYILLVEFLKISLDQVRLMNLTMLCAFIAFSLDSFMNFPAERPTIQIQAFLFLALILSLTTKAKSFRIPKFIPIVLILISGTLIYANYQMFTSSKMDLKIRDWDKGFNMFTQKYPISYNELVAEYSGFPDLHGLGKSKELVKAKFAYSEGRYKTAMNHLNRAIRMTPYQQEHKALKAVIFELNKGMKNPDSSYHYAKMVYRERPSLVNMERILKLTHKRKKDPRTLKQFLEDHKK